MIYLSRSVVALVSFNAFDSVDSYTALRWEQFDQHYRLRMSLQFPRMIWSVGQIIIVHGRMKIRVL